MLLFKLLIQRVVTRINFICTKFNQIIDFVNSLIKISQLFLIVGTDPNNWIKLTTLKRFETIDLLNFWYFRLNVQAIFLIVKLINNWWLYLQVLLLKLRHNAPLKLFNTVQIPIVLGEILLNECMNHFLIHLICKIGVYMAQHDLNIFMDSIYFLFEFLNHSTFTFI